MTKLWFRSFFAFSLLRAAFGHLKRIITSTKLYWTTLLKYYCNIKKGRLINSRFDYFLMDLNMAIICNYRCCCFRLKLCVCLIFDSDIMDMYRFCGVEDWRFVLYGSVSKTQFSNTLNWVLLKNKPNRSYFKAHILNPSVTTAILFLKFYSKYCPTWCLQ